MDPDALLDLAAGQGLLAAGRAVVVMLSGGRDSTCLLDLSQRIAGPDAVTALHVNYGLRPDADSDERHCAGLCDRLGVELVTRSAARPEGAGNLHAWARDVRYGEAVRLAAPGGADIATGHTASDQAETVLYRLAASPGRRALLGMSPRDGRLVRPLLGVSRDDTAAYCSARGLGWVEDSSNDDPAYARARVRGPLLDALRGVHPAAEANVVSTAALLRDEAEVLESVVDAEIGDAGEVEIERLAAMPPALARLVVRRLAERAVQVPCPAAPRRLRELLALDGSLDLEGGTRATVRRGVLSFGPTPPVGA